MSKTTSGLIAKGIAKQMNLPEEVCSAVISEFLYAVRDEVRSGRNVVLTGLGSLVWKPVKPSSGHIVSTGGRWQRPATRILRWKPSDKLRRETSWRNTESF